MRESCETYCPKLFTQLIDKDGAVFAEFSYDPWGRMRQPQDWSKFTQDYTYPEHFDILERGFTGHEHMVEFGLINMNGRVYDPVLGQFIQPDNYVQFPEYAGSYNRYSYCLNNPLMFTDPSGEFIETAGAILFWVGVFSSCDKIIDSFERYGLEAGMKNVFITSLSYLVSAGVSSAFGLESITAEKLLSWKSLGLYAASSVTTDIIISGMTTGFEGYSWNSFGMSVLGGAKNWVSAVGWNWISGSYKAQNNPQKDELLGFNTNAQTNTNPEATENQNKVIVSNALVIEGYASGQGEVVYITDPGTEETIKAIDQNGNDVSFKMKDVQETCALTLIPKSKLTKAEQEYLKTYPESQRLSPDDKYYIITDRKWFSRTYGKNLPSQSTRDDMMKFSLLEEQLHVGLNKLGLVSLHQPKNIPINSIFNQNTSIFNTFRNNWTMWSN